MTFWQRFFCNVLDWHQRGVTIRAGWAVTACQRCHETLKAERLPDVPP